MQRLILAALLALSAYSQTTPDPYTWTAVTPALATPRADACAFALPDGSAFLSGGIGLDGNATAPVEGFTPAAGFAPAPR